MEFINFKGIFRSRDAYEYLHESGFLVLPSQRILRYHKNKIKQTPGTCRLWIDFK